MTREIEEKIKHAQMVLVGIGKEPEEKFCRMEQDPQYARLLEQAEKLEQAETIKQYLHLAWLRSHPDRKKKKAYERLAELLTLKIYFLVTLCPDDAIFGNGLDEGRIVTPCGGFRALQCPSLSCPSLSNTARQEPEPHGPEDHDSEVRSPEAQVPETQVSETEQPPCGIFSDAALWEEPVSRLEAGEDPGKIAFPRCPECGCLLAFNRITTPGYLEEGYLPQWEKYQKWLQGTLNRKLCILELGAGMEYPSVIRFPFERVAFFNLKSELIRVHSRLYQMTAELKDRGTPIQADPVEFLLG